MAWLALLVPGSAAATSLRFFGNGEGGIDRVTIRIDAPAKPADVGATDFTLEWWMRAEDGDNASEAVACDTNDGWIFGNILFDRDVYGAGAHGDFGVSLTGGRVAFGVSAGSAGNTICGATSVTDGAWHHVAVTRQRSNGRLRIYVDGVLDAEGDGNIGSDKDVSYPNGLVTGHEWDPFLVIGAEKHDAGSLYPSFSGWIDEVRLSTVRRYTGSGFTRPLSPFTSDGSTAALYHLDEGADDFVGDASGGNSHGTRMYGGTPAGPVWSSDGAPLDSARRATLEQVISGAGRPVAIANAGDGRLFVVDANGRILAYEVTESGPFNFLGVYLDIQDRVLCCGERGLLGLAFHPNYATNGYFVVYYTAKASGDVGNGDVVIARYRASTAASNSVDPSTESILLTIGHSTYTNHNGGGLAFGPDGYLYAAVGDGGGGGDPLQSGQNRGTLLGKVLRLAVDVSGGPAPYYSIPADNPFVDTAGTRPEIWAWGLRNPWRIAFDRLTGDLFVADVGQGNREEVNFQPAGSDGSENYGWPRMEGTACYNPGSGCQTGSLVLPILEYGHGEGCSVTGGYRYRGSRVPTLHGAYLFADFCTKKIWVGVQGPSGTWSRHDLLATSLSITTFGEDADGELYVAHIGGTVHRVARVRPRLTVTRSGGGAGTVSGPGGLDCGAACSVAYEPGQIVTLTAAVPGSSRFAGWSGACGGTGECLVVMDGDRAVTATLNPRPTLQFSASTYTASEDGGSATITVERLVALAGTVTVDYAIAAGSAVAPPAAEADFAGPGSMLTGTLTFTPGQSTKSFTIPIVNDTRAEGPETVLLSLHNPSPGSLLGARPTAVLTITNHDVAGAFWFSQAAYSASEGSPSALLTVYRSSGAANAEVTWTIVPKGTTALLGPDYTTPGDALTGTLLFGANVGGQTIPITLRRQGDTVADGSRTIKVRLSDPKPAGFASLATQAVTTLTITDDDSAGTLQFTPASVTASEAAGQAVLTVTRSQKASGVTVDWAVMATESTALPNTDYGGPTSGTLAFAADVLSQAIQIPLVDRNGAQGSRTLRVRLSNARGGATLGGQTIATLTITDDEVGVRAAQATSAVNEGYGSAAITILRTGPTAPAVTVNYATGDAGDTATPALTPTVCSAGADYLPIPAGALTFNPGETSKTVLVTLCGDSIEEGAETLTLRLTGVTPNAHLGAPATTVLTIQENDEGGSLQWYSATTSVSEGKPHVALYVLRSGGSAGSVTVDYVIAGGSATAPPPAGEADFAGPAPSGSLTGTLAFAANVTYQTLTIPLVNDSVIEPNETFTVTLQNAQGGATLGSLAVASVTIVDNDRSGTVQFSQATATAHEYAPFVRLTVTRTGSTSALATVNYQVTGDTTAVVQAALAGTVTFNPGQWSVALDIPLLDDAIRDGNSTLTVTLTPPLTGGLALGTPNPATVTLVDEEGTVQFAASVFTVKESQWYVPITLTRTGGTAKAVTVQVATGDPGDSASPASSPWGCSTGADYRPILPTSLTFYPGETVKSFGVYLCGDSVVETPSPETLTLRLLSVTPPATLGAQDAAVLRIQEDDGGGKVAFSSASYSVTEGTSTATLTVLRTGGAAGSVTVPWHLGGDAVAGTDYLAPTSGPIQFGPGQTVAYFQIPILNDTLVDGTRTLIATLDAPAGGATLGSPSVATLRVDDNEPTVRFSSSTYAVGESGTVVYVLVWRLGPTNTQVDVTVQSTAAGTAEAGPCGTGGDYTPVGVLVTFLPGQTGQWVPITLCPDAEADGTETIGLALANPVGATLGTPNTAMVTITENDVAGKIQFAAAANSVSEAQGTATVLVTRTGGEASGVTVHWRVNGGTAVHGIAPASSVDYMGETSGTLMFGEKQMSQALTIPIQYRPNAQGPRSVELLLDLAGGGGALGVQTSATLWILDAD